MTDTNFELIRQLKYDAFGSIDEGYYLASNGEKIHAIRRNYPNNPFFLLIAGYLARNERKALERLMPLQNPSLPTLLHSGRGYHIRSFIAGNSMHRCPERLTPDFFLEAKALIKAMRRAGVCNNDLSKEANWIVTEQGTPAVTDFQLGLVFKKNRKLLRILSREDIRHLLKHKRKYLTVTAAEQSILQTKSFVTQLWMNTGKKLYLFVTRKLLGWENRTGPEERNI